MINSHTPSKDILFYFDLMLKNGKIKKIAVHDNDDPAEIVSHYAKGQDLDYKSMMTLEKFLAEKMKEHRIKKYYFADTNPEDSEGV